MPGKPKSKENTYITMTLRIDRKTREVYDKLAAEYDRSRNNVLCIALRYAQDKLDDILK